MLIDSGGNRLRHVFCDAGFVHLSAAGAEMDVVAESGTMGNRVASRLPEFLSALAASRNIEYDGQHQHQASDDVLEGNVRAHEVHAARQ
jgi:hypothetical protein